MVLQTFYINYIATNKIKLWFYNQKRLLHIVLIESVTVAFKIKYII